MLGVHGSSTLMELSTYAIELMGFKPIPAGETIEAEFHSLHVFEVRGFTVKDGGVVSHSASVSGTDYTLAVGGSVNDVYRSIVGDIFTQDEEAWAKEHGCTPPYAVVHFGPTSRHAVTQGHAKPEGGGIVTYDLFGAAKKELRRLEEALPSIEMALVCAFSSGGQFVQLGVIAPVPGIMRLFWAFSSSNPPESPSQEDSSLANMLDTLEARCRSDGPPAGPRSIDPLPGSRSFLTVSAVA